MKKKLLLLLPLMAMLLGGCSKTQTGQLKAGETLVVYVDAQSYNYICQPGHTYRGADGQMISETEPQLVRYEIHPNKAVIEYSRCEVTTGSVGTGADILYSYEEHNRVYFKDIYYSNSGRISYSIHNSNNQ